MKIESLYIKNFRRYGTVQIDFEKGQTQIIGENGSGKSSLLQAVYFGLYQTDGIRQFEEDITLDSLVRKGESNAVIRVTFSVEDEEYTTEWELSTSGTGEDRSARTRSCSIRGSELEDPISGVKSVSNYVSNLLGMDAKSFINSVFIKQGDINRIIYASKKEKTQIFDRLLGLERVDRHIDRAKKARREAKASRNKKEAKVEQIQSQLAERESKENLQKQKGNKENELSEYESLISKARDKKVQLRNRISQLEDELDSVQEKKEEIEQVDEALSKVREEKRTLVSDMKSKQEKRKSLTQTQKELEQNIKNTYEELYGTHRVPDGVGPIRDEISQITSDIELLSNQEESANEEVYSAEQEEFLLDENIEQIQTDIEEKEESLAIVQSELRKKQSELANELEEIQRLTDVATEAFESALTECRQSGVQLSFSYGSLLSEETLERAETVTKEEISSLNEELKSVNSDISRLTTIQSQITQLEEEGVCPVCNTAHEEREATKRKNEHEQCIQNKEGERRHIKQKISSLESLLDCIKDIMVKRQDVKQRRSNTQSIISEIGELTEKMRSLYVSIEALEAKERDTVHSTEELKQRKLKFELTSENIARRKEFLQNRRDSLDSLKDIYTEYNSVYEKRLEIDDRITSLKEEKKQAEEEATRLKEKLDSLPDTVEATNITSEIADRKEELKKVSETIPQYENKLSSLEKDIGSIVEQINTIEQSKVSLSKTQEEKEDIEQCISQINNLIDSYQKVKKNIRGENISLLNKYVNSVFSDIYSSNTYQSIHISKDYDITLKDAEGSSLSPEMTSGGESALLNLALRAGVYRLISERRGKTSSLPPLILDEPTTYLDTTHVEKLQSLLKSIREWDTEQLFVVSHDESLQATGDATLQVDKRPSNGTSYVRDLTADNG